MRSGLLCRRRKSVAGVINFLQVPFHAVVYHSRKKTNDRWCTKIKTPILLSLFYLSFLLHGNPVTIYPSKFLLRVHTLSSRHGCGCIISPACILATSKLLKREIQARGPTPQRVGWTVTGPSLAGRLHSLVFCYWVSSRKSHTTRRRGHLRVAISTVPDPLGAGRVDMLTSPVAAARAAAATGAWVTKHVYLIRGSVGA